MNQEACPRCGAPRAAATPFCTNCGTPFSTSAGTPPGDAPTMVSGGQPGGAPWGPPSGQPGMPPQPGAPWGPPPGGGQQDAGQWGPPQGPGGPGGPGQWGPGPQPGGGNRGKIALIVGVVLLVLIGGGIAAALVLGGDDDDDNGNGNGNGSSETISTEEFCNAWTELDEIEGEDMDALEEGKALLSDLKERGTPDDMPADAKEGFDVYMEFVESIDDPDDVMAQGNELSEEEQRRMQSFLMYMADTCETGGDAPSIEAPSITPPPDFPSEMPTDYPTEFDPSDYGLDEDDLKELEELESMLSEYATPQ